MKNFHVWFSTKWRRPVLSGEVRDFVLSSILSVAAEKGIEVLELEAIEDHVHLLVVVKEEQRLPQILHDLKGASARATFLRYPDLRAEMAGDAFWQKSYGSRLVWPNQISTVRRYIRTQNQRPLHRD